MIYFRTSVSPTIKDFFEIFDELFEVPTTISSNNCTSRKCPIHDVIEDDNKFTVEMILAGIKKEDVSIDIESDKLIIKAERKENKDLKYNRKETYFGKYERAFILPNNVDKENIGAEFADGILVITVPKILDDTKGKKKVEIK